MATDVITASLAVGRGAAELGSDVVAALGIGVLVGGLEWAQCGDLLIAAGTISPAHVPPEE